MHRVIATFLAVLFSFFLSPGLAAAVPVNPGSPVMAVPVDESLVSELSYIDETCGEHWNPKDRPQPPIAPTFSIVKQMRRDLSTQPPVMLAPLWTEPIMVTLPNCPVARLAMGDGRDDPDLAELQVLRR
ncbi:hypothetical protein D5S17_04930 [Pseudonocardiaceae bacterium YIM PH 21723]|nr:hypothetical protein D5S17_04930 [Pseudonocardiaceae bacterium YIM PH 21723]